MSEQTTVIDRAELIERGQLFIAGEWVDSTGEGSIAVVNPATEATIATVPNGSVEDVDRAVTAAANAFETWSRTSVDERVELIRDLSRRVETRKDEITRSIVREVGQPYSEAEWRQVGAAIDDLEIIAESLSQITWAESVSSGTVRRVPAGVVAAIVPWNMPLRTVVLKAAAAMAAGCTVVLKGSEVAPLTSFIFAELVADAGGPAGVLNVVSGTGPSVGEPLVSHQLVDAISLTGSVRAGSRVMELASSSIKRVALELGGKSANIIFEDAADFDRAVVDGIGDAFRNSGQVCGGLTRMLVPRERLADAERLAIDKAESYVLGDPFAATTTLGPVVSATQRDRVRKYIQIGIDEGAHLLTGGTEAPDGLERGYFVKPTIFTGDNSMRIAREEVFGPVVVIIPFDGEDDAIAIANDSPYGLAGGVWAADNARARALAGRIRTGRVRINGAPIDRRLPHGGFKLSGLGREWGRFGVEEFLEIQSIIG